MSGYGNGHYGHGKINIDPEAYHRAASKSILYRLLHTLPGPARVPVGTVMVMASGYMTYLLVRPSQRNRPVHTLTPEWQAASAAYADAQNINPIRRYKEEAAH